MKRKFISILLMSSMVLSAAACSNSDGSDKNEPEDTKAEVTEAEETTAAPTETKSECELNGHTWVDADCYTPKTCSVCGETEGDPLEHDLTEANYQSGPVCNLCEEEIGDKIPADFETYGITCDVAIGEVYQLETICYEDTSKHTVGNWTFSDYNTFESSDELEAVEGYEYRTLTLSVYYDDDNAMSYGVWPFVINGDYYDCQLDEEEEEDEGNTLNEEMTYTVNFNGIDYDQCYGRCDSNGAGWNSAGTTYSASWTFTVLMPVGYDGTCICAVNAEHIQDFVDGTYNYVDLVNSGSLIFRMA